MNSKRTSSLSASQPINSVASTSSLTSTGHSRSHHNRRQHSVQNNNDSYSSVDSSDSNDNQSKSLFELCILSGMNKRQNNSNTSTNNSRDKQLYSGAKMSVSSNPNLKMVDSLNDSLQKKHPEFLKQQHQPHQTHSTSHSRLQRERERKDEQLLMECINTGISKKISGAIAITKENVPAQRPTLKLREAASSSMPKNGIATSAVALEQHHQTEATISPSVHSTAAPGVEMNIANHLNTNIQHNSIDDIIDVQKNPLTELSLTPTLAINIISTNIECQSPEIVQERMNVTGCRSLQQSEIQNSDSLDITESDSTESFIMETTFSIDNNKKSTYFTSNKHKDPDLMLKSVERLTQEFVSSAEQSRINGSNEINEQNHRPVVAKNSIADTTSSTSNNTWNEDTCPNDISFPSVSVTAPVVGLLNYSGSDDDNDDDDEEATDADHRDLNDFAEITPTNEEQPSPSLGLIYDELDIYANQPLNSIDTETETETLVNDNYTATNKISEVTSTINGINFMLGGKVQTAAATRSNSSFLNSAMHHSAIIAMEARDLADNFLETYEDSNDLTYSISSLDLDNIRPPSCMDSMNISGYYQDSFMSANNIGGGLTQYNSMQKLQQKAQPVSPHISANSPKFPRKSLPAGIVARRALGQLPGGLSGSAESVNSSCNFLDNIKPPSLMDELLDSMMSVASIQSEIADCESLATTLSLSNYETAAAGGGGGVIEFDDNTITLHSCCDTIPHDDNDEEVSINCETLLPSDNEYTSAESTPKKSTAGSSSPGVKRTLTPKQKRKLVKDRYKTYTIAADIVLNEVQQKQQQYDMNNLDDDEKIQVEIEEYTFVREPNMQNVGEKKPDISRYQTQNIVFPVQYSLTQASNHFIE